MSDIKKGYTFTDKSTDWASNKETAIRLNKMMDEAKVNLVAGTNVTITPTLNGPQIDVTGAGTGSVTSIDVDGGTGISVSPAGPITTAGTFTVTNTAPDLTVVLSGGTGITTSGTYPNFTVTNSAPDQTVALTQGGTTTITGTYPNFTISSADQYTGTVTGVSVVSANGLAGSATTGATPAITLSTTVSGLVKGNGTALSAATAGTDYVIPSGSITGTAGNVTGIVAVANGGSGTSSPSLVAGTNVTISGSWPNQTINSTAGGGGGGTVTSIDVDGGTGISVSPAGPITTSGTFTVTNTAPDQTVSIASGTGISASGTYPNFTVTNTAPDQTVSISAGTNISVTGSYPSFTVGSTAVAIPTTGNKYSRLRKDITGTIGSASDMSWAGPDVFNVADYGSATAAINALNTAGRGCLYFPAGTYSYSTALPSITKPCLICGDGAGATYITFTGIDGFVIDYSGARASCEITSLTINTADSSVGSTLKSAIKFTQFSNTDLNDGFRFHHLEISGRWGYGIRIIGAFNSIQGSSISDVKISCFPGENKTLTSSGQSIQYGIHMDKASNVMITSTTIFESYYGLYIKQQCEGTSIANCIVVNCNTGVYSEGSNTFISNSHFNVSSGYVSDTAIPNCGIGINLTSVSTSYPNNHSNLSHAYIISDCTSAIGLYMQNVQYTLVNCFRVLGTPSSLKYGIYMTGNGVSGGINATRRNFICQTNIQNTTDYGIYIDATVTLGNAIYDALFTDLVSGCVTFQDNGGGATTRSLIVM